MLSKSPIDTLRVDIGQHSRAGAKPSNQDFHGACVPSGAALGLKGIAVAIADGISTSEVSHIAAETAVKSFLADYYCTPDAWSVKTAGERVLTAINSWLYSQSRAGGLTENMDRAYVCTFTAIVLKGRQAHIFHVGDSRLYRMAGNSMEQLTSDHRTALSGDKHCLARALGLTPSTHVDYDTIDLRLGDVLLLATDGIHEYVTAKDVARAIASSSDLDQAANIIADHAAANHSTDNLTVQLIKVENFGNPDALDALGLADSLPPAPIPNIPCEFDGYRLVRQIHASSRSHIYLAVDLDTGKQVALKIPSMDLRDDPNYLRRFAMEEWIARRIESPHTLKAEPHRQRNALYTVTELIDGQTLRQWINDNPSPDIATVRGIVDQIVKGLRALHRKDMIHQDLRPENIMIDADGTVKIIDFGAVQVAGLVEADPFADSEDILGTHQYAAPEYFLGYAGTKTSDLYSLGVIAYEMLTGRLPYGARMARAHNKSSQQRASYTSVSTYRNDIPLWVDAALRKAVQADPNRRQAALSEFMHDLMHPRPGLVGDGRAPILERNPVLFWQLISLGFATLALWQAVS